MVATSCGGGLWERDDRSNQISHPWGAYFREKQEPRQFARPGRAAGCEAETESKPDRPELGSPTTHPDSRAVVRSGGEASAVQVPQLAALIWILTGCGSPRRRDAHFTPSRRQVDTGGWAPRLTDAACLPGGAVSSRRPSRVRVSSTGCGGGNDCLPCTRSAFRLPFACSAGLLQTAGAGRTAGLTSSCAWYGD